LVGDFQITANVSISEGEKIGMVLFFGKDNYYTFELSSTTSNVSGIGRYLDGNLTSFDPHPYLCAYNTVQNITLRNEGGTVFYEVNGQSLGSVSIASMNGQDSEGPFVGFAAIDAIGKMDWIIIQNDTTTMRDDFTINVCPELRNWNTIGSWVIGTALTQYYDYEGEMPAIVYSSEEIADQLSGVTFVDPGSVSYHMVDPTDINVQINDSSGPFILILKNSYADWKLTIDGEEITPSSHFLVNGYANGWVINKTGNFTIHATYAPQGDFKLGINISIVALASVIGLMAVLVVWPMLPRNAIKNRRK
jgi:hypothetical protein